MPSGQVPSPEAQALLATDLESAPRHRRVPLRACLLAAFPQEPARALDVRADVVHRLTGKVPLAPKRSNNFQRLIYLIEQALAPGQTRITESAMVNDLVTGLPREVDVLIEGQVSGHSVSLGIECRDHERPQDVAWIDGLVGKYRDLPVDRVLAVSSSGFTPAAVAKAKKVRIDALTFAEALGRDWPQEFKQLCSELIAVGPVTLRKVDIEFRGDSSPPMDGSTPLVVVGVDGKSEGDLRDYCHRIFQDYGLPQVPLFIDRHKDEFFNDTKTRTEIICAQYGDARHFIEVADGTRFPLKSITLHIACPFEFLPMADRRFGYRETLVTIASAEHAGHTASLTFVQVPETQGAEVKIAEFSVSRDRAPNSKKV